MATPNITVQTKGGTTKVSAATTGGATRLVELSDVQSTPVSDQEVLTYVAANTRFEFKAQVSETANDFYARIRANGAFDEANTANVTAQAAFDRANLTYTFANTVNVVAQNAYSQANIATSNADAAFAQANAAYANANTAIYTAAQIRANISNVAPILYDPSTGVITHLQFSDTGVYGNSTYVPVISVDSSGHVIAVTNTAITYPANTDQFARDLANAAFNQANLVYANANTAIYTASQIRANISNVAPILYDSSTGVITHLQFGDQGVYGNSMFVPQITVDSSGHVIAVSNVAINAPDQFARDQANAAFGTANAAYGRANSAYSQANVATVNADAAFAQANGAYNRANAAYANANTAIYTASQIRANISNVAPILYDPATGIITHLQFGDQGVYGNTTYVPQITVDSSGHTIAVTNVAITFPPDQFARDQANASFSQANAAFTQANVAYVLANTQTFANLHDVIVSGIPSINPALQSNGAVIFYDNINTKYSFTHFLNGGAF